MSSPASRFTPKVLHKHLLEMACAAAGAKTVFCHCSLFQEKNAQLLGTAQQLFTHCQAQKEEIKRLFQQKLDEVPLCWGDVAESAACKHFWASQVRPEQSQIFSLCFAADQAQKGAICGTLWLCFVFCVFCWNCCVPKEGDKPQPGGVW